MDFQSFSKGFGIEDFKSTKKGFGFLDFLDWTEDFFQTLTECNARIDDRLHSNRDLEVSRFRFRDVYFPLPSASVGAPLGKQQRLLLSF